MEEKQILQDKTNTDLKVDFKMIGYNDMEKIHWLYKGKWLMF